MLHLLLRYLRDQVFREWLIALFPSFVAIWFFLKGVPAMLRAKVSRDWPTAQGRVETVTVKTVGNQSLAEVGYSYAVCGSRHSGYLSRQFGDEQVAWDAVSGLKDQNLVVRYRETNPEISAIRAADQASDFDFKSDAYWMRIWRRLSGGMGGLVYPRRL